MLLREAGDESAIAKTSQALREGASKRLPETATGRRELSRNKPAVSPDITPSCGGASTSSKRRKMGEESSIELFHDEPIREDGLAERTNDHFLF